jgi:hypothetical protein
LIFMKYEVDSGLTKTIIYMNIPKNEVNSKEMN